VRKCTLKERGGEGDDRRLVLRSCDTSFRRVHCDRPTWRVVEWGDGAAFTGKGEAG
jgi:hypothetical protein